MTSETTFDTTRHHIHVEIIVINPSGIELSVDGILDTGTPRTEFSDVFLSFAGFIDFIDAEKNIKHGLQPINMIK